MHPTGTLSCYRPQNAVWGKVMFLHVFFILFTGEEGLHLGVGLHPGGRRSDSEGKVGQTPSSEIEKRAAHILLECFLV